MANDNNDKSGGLLSFILGWSLFSILMYLSQFHGVEGHIAVKLIATIVFGLFLNVLAPIIKRKHFDDFSNREMIVIVIVFFGVVWWLRVYVLE